VFQDEFIIYYIRLPKEQIEIKTNEVKEGPIKKQSQVPKQNLSKQTYEGLFGSDGKFKKKAKDGKVNFEKTKP
jgi:hypothetical protein